MNEPIKHYISAYGIAVKHGFKGTEAEWLETLIGGNAELRYNAENDCIEYKHTRSDEWVVLMTLAEFRGAIAEEIISSVNGAVEEANKAKEDSTAAASDLQAAVSEAKSAKNDAEKAENSARNYANSAASLARAAALAACDEKLGAVLTKLKGIESGANKTVIDEEFSENSSNPVANYILLEALRTKLNSVTFNAHKGDKNNPHGVTAHLVGAYTKSETDKAIEEAIKLGSIDSEALNTKADKAEVFEDTSFGWLEFELTESREGIESEEVKYFNITESEISGSQSGAILVIHCKGDVLGFSASLTEGSEICRLKVNGNYVINYSYGEGETVYATEPILMTEDIEIELNIMSALSFTNMKKQYIKGMGDISSALAEILALENQYINGGAENE